MEELLFKNKKIKNDYNNQDKRNKDNIILRKWLYIINYISILTGHGPITITDYFREGEKWKVSLHFKKYGGRAGDVRVRDKSTIWYLAMFQIGIAFNLLNKKFRMNVHPELFRKKQQHIHIEIRTIKTR